jgi:hypothetical protein
VTSRFKWTLDSFYDPHTNCMLAICTDTKGEILSGSEQKEALAVCMFVDVLLLLDLYE